MGAPTTTLTSSNNFHFVDDHSSDPLHVGVRQLEFSEVLKISGFDDDLNATAFLKPRSEENTLKTVASAIPPPTLFQLYRAIVNHAIGVHLSLREVNSLEETSVIDLHPDRDLPPCDDGDFALFAADVVTQSVDYPADFQSGEEALSSMLRLGATRNEGLHVSPLNVSSSSCPKIDAVHSTSDSQDGDLSIDGITHDTSRSNVDMLVRQADVRTMPPSREVSTTARPPLHPRGSKAWRRKVALVWRYHGIWHHPKELKEQHLAASGADNHGLERGESRYFVWRCNWCALGGMDRFVRPRATKSLIDYA